MRKQLWWYIGFFVILLAGFFYFTLRDQDFSKSPLAVINPDIQNFSFINQNSRTITEKDVEGKVYVAAFFFTTCKGICPKLNTHMKDIYAIYKNEPDFQIVSHTCNPGTDSVSVLKKYADSLGVNTKTWVFLTGRKDSLYQMARGSYLLDDPKNNVEKIEDQFIHTQFFALIDRNGKVRGKIYDGLKTLEIEQLKQDIAKLLKDK